MSSKSFKPPGLYPAVSEKLSRTYRELSCQREQGKSLDLNKVVILYKVMREREKWCNILAASLESRFRELHTSDTFGKFGKFGTLRFPVTVKSEFLLWAPL